MTGVWVRNLGPFISDERVELFMYSRAFFSSLLLKAHTPETNSFDLLVGVGGPGNRFE